MPRRGEIYLVDLGNNEGSEQNGERPVLIIQNDVGNQFSPTVIVAALTDVSKRYMPTHVLIRQRDALSKDSHVLLEQIRTIDKRRIIKRLAVAPDEVMAEVDHKIKISLGLVPVPSPQGGGRG
ncbi:MAG: type II toxin-antitoxin system PemK/MazF family toxin [Cohnella sp.]|nr:type II toxin-antitoxin system PemK/MazF family toxin [Cohnella sp.]